MMYRETWSRTSLFCSSEELVVAQLSALSAWRLTHTARTATMPMIVPSTSRVRTAYRRPRGSVAASSTDGSSATARVPVAGSWTFVAGSLTSVAGSEISVFASLSSPGVGVES